MRGLRLFLLGACMIYLALRWAPSWPWSRTAAIFAAYAFGWLVEPVWRAVWARFR